MALEEDDVLSPFPSSWVPCFFPYTCSIHPQSLRDGAADRSAGTPQKVPVKLHSSQPCACTEGGRQKWMSYINGQANKRNMEAGEGRELSQRKYLKPVMLLAPIHFSSFTFPLWNCLTLSYSSFTTRHRNHLFQEALQFIPAWVTHVDLRHTASPLSAIHCGMVSDCLLSPYECRAPWGGEWLCLLSIWVWWWWWWCLI